MWETIGKVLTSPNAGIVLTFCLFIGIIVWLLTKSGLLNIHTENVSLGAANAEREIIRQQVEWARLHLDAIEMQLKFKDDDYDIWHSKYVIEKIYDEIVTWITFNHLNMSSAYVEVKQDKIINLLKGLVLDEDYRTEDFEQFIRDDVKKSIEKLIQIRNVYK
jgi:hypothetical protein